MPEGFTDYQRRALSLSLLALFCHLIHPPPRYGCLSDQGLQDTGMSCQEEPPSRWEPSAAKLGEGPGVLHAWRERGVGRKSYKERKRVAGAVIQSSRVPPLPLITGWGN